MLNALIIAFSTYSKLPMPQVDWKEENMKYAICFFPMIGAAIGALLLFWVWLCGALALNSLLRAAGAAVLPLLVSGGIHMDGLCDTADALACHQSQARRLEILKDSHTGAFAIIACSGFLLLYFGALSQPEGWRPWGVVALGFVLSRALSGLALANFKGARPSGMLQAFAAASHRSVVTAAMITYAGLAAAGMLLLSPVQGGAAVLAALLCLLYYRRIAYRQFGGITGDLAGFFLELCELWTALAVALTGRFSA